MKQALKNKAGEICNSLIYELNSLYSIYKNDDLVYDESAFNIISNKDLTAKQKMVILLELLRRSDPELDDQMRSHFFTLDPINEFIPAR